MPNYTAHLVADKLRQARERASEARTRLAVALADTTALYDQLPQCDEKDDVLSMVNDLSTAYENTRWFERDVMRFLKSYQVGHPLV